MVIQPRHDEDLEVSGEKGSPDTALLSWQSTSESRTGHCGQIRALCWERGNGPEAAAETRGARQNRAWVRGRDGCRGQCSCWLGIPRIFWATGKWLGTAAFSHYQQKKQSLSPMRLRHLRYKHPAPPTHGVAPPLRTYLQQKKKSSNQPIPAQTHQSIQFKVIVRICLSCFPSPANIWLQRYGCSGGAPQIAGGKLQF